MMADRNVTRNCGTWNRRGQPLRLGYRTEILAYNNEDVVNSLCVDNP